MIIIGILLSIFSPDVTNLIKNQRIVSTINELDIIANSTQNYATLNQSSTNVLNYTFPDQANQCQNAITTMQNTSFIIGINSTSTWFDEPFYTSCSTQTFSISIGTNTANAIFIRNTLGSVDINGYVATYTVNKPTLLPIINDGS